MVISTTPKPSLAWHSGSSMARHLKPRNSPEALRRWFPSYNGSVSRSGRPFILLQAKLKGTTYIRKDLLEKYGGQLQKGIWTPREFPVVFIFTGASGKTYGYEDGWTDDGIFRYTGKNNRATTVGFQSSMNCFLDRYKRLVYVTTFFRYNYSLCSITSQCKNYSWSDSASTTPNSITISDESYNWPEIYPTSSVINSAIFAAKQMSDPALSK
mgnify:CR=1 FL=1